MNTNNVRLNRKMLERGSRFNKFLGDRIMKQARRNKDNNRIESPITRKNKYAHKILDKDFNNFLRGGNTRTWDNKPQPIKKGYNKLNTLYHMSFEVSTTYIDMNKLKPMETIY